MHIESLRTSLKNEQIERQEATKILVLKIHVLPPQTIEVNARKLKKLRKMKIMMILVEALVLNSGRKKIFLAGCVSYAGGKQDMHLCVEVKKTRWKCHVNFVDGMLEGNVYIRIVCASRKLYNHW